MTIRQPKNTPSPSQFPALADHHHLDLQPTFFSTLDPTIVHLPEVSTALILPPFYCPSLLHTVSPLFYFMVNPCATPSPEQGELTGWRTPQLSRAKLLSSSGGTVASREGTPWTGQGALPHRRHGKLSAGYTSTQVGRFGRSLSTFSCGYFCSRGTAARPSNEPREVRKEVPEDSEKKKTAVGE